MVRNKLAAAIAAIGALQAGMVNALGMGDFSLNSALNQPLNAEIRLLSTEDLDPTQVKIRLADPAEFKNAGVSRDFFLTNLKFNVEMDGRGGGVIKVSTRESVLEPYLNFLIEARWPSGRLLREYTVLLDLPVFSEVEAAPVAAARSKMTTAPASSQKVASTTRRTSTSPVRQSLQQGKLTPGGEYRVKHDDTLWAIAVKNRPAQGITVQQTMVEIQSLNPQAFINGNINRLKAGSVLRLPTDQDISISDRQAVSEVASQNRAWRQGDDTGNAPQLDATTADVNSDADVSDQPRLSLATGGDAAGMSDGAGTVDASGTEALQNELAITAETLDKTTRENVELEQNLTHLEEKLATVQRLLELKSDQLANMQANAETPQINENAVTDIADTTPIEEAPVENSPAEKVVEPVPAPAPNTSDQWFSNPLILGGGAAGLLLLIAGFVLMRRRQAEAEEAEFDVIDLEDNNVLADESPVQESEFVIEEEADSTDDLAAELEQQIAADNAEETARAAEQALLEEEQMTEPESPVNEPALTSETGDAIAEADIYIAYGRYQQAIDLLRSAIAQEPQRSDLQVKLLEVCVETRDKPGFQQQFVELEALGDDSAIINVKEMLSSVDGVSDWLNDLPGSMNDFSDADMDADLLDSADDIELDLGELDLDGLDSTENLSSTIETDVLTDTDLELDDLDLDTSFEENEIIDIDTSGKTLVMDAATINAELADQNALPDDTFELDLDGDLDLDLDLDSADLGDLAAEFDEEPNVPEVTDEVDIAPVTSSDADLESSDDDFDFLSETDEVATKLDLARAYIDMGDTEGARDIIEEVQKEGTDEQQQEAKALMARID